MRAFGKLRHLYQLAGRTGGLKRFLQEDRPVPDAVVVQERPGGQCHAALSGSGCVIPNIAASIHARLLARAKEKGEDFSLTLTRYATERFLYR